MCHETSAINDALEALETAAEQLSTTQERNNTPLFDLLFKLANLPQTPGLAAGKLKVLHTYAHRFIEFYVTECPDGVSLDGFEVNEVISISNRLRSMGDGLARLLNYFGMTQENEQLIEYVDSIACGYDTFASMLSRYECICNELEEDDECGCCECDCCDDECGEDASCYKKCGACECGLCCGDDDDEEDDEEEEVPSGANAQGESVDKLFERLFGRTPTDAIPQNEPPKKNDAVAEDLATMFTGFLSAMVGDKKGMDAAADAAARLEKRIEQDEVKAKAKMQAEQPKPKAEEKPAQPTEAEVLAKVLSDMLGCEVRVKKVPNTQPRIGVREVRPGLWNFCEE